MAQILQLSGKLSIMPPPVLEELDVTENGKYEGAYGEVNVNVQPKLEELEVVENGVYEPSEGKDGFNKVTVEIPSENPYSIEFDSDTFLALADLRKMISNIDAGSLFEKTVMTKSLQSRTAALCFSYLNKVKNLDVTMLDVSTVTSFANCFTGCASLTELDLSNWVSNGSRNCNSIFSMCTSLRKIWIPSTFHPKVASSMQPLAVYTNYYGSDNEHTHVYTDGADAVEMNWANIDSSYVVHYNATHEEYEEA